MGHVVIFGCIVILLAGSWTAFATRQALERTGLPLLNHLLHHVVFFNLSVFVYLVARYAFTNLLGEDPSAAHPVWLVALFSTGFLVEVGVSYTLVQVAYALREGPVPRAVTRSFYVGAAVFGAAFIVGTTLTLEGGNVRWLRASYAALALSAVLVIMVYLTWLAAGRHLHLETGRRRCARSFGAMMLSGWILLAGASLVPEPYKPLAGSLCLLGLNLLPLIWLRTSLATACTRPAVPPGGSALDAITSEHGITNREREIVELILQGMSNKEIEDQLCISFNTVKNHVYNIFRKLGINSRGQLAYLVMQTQEELDAGLPRSGGEAGITERAE